MTTAWRKVKTENDLNFTIQDMLKVYYGESDYAKYDNSACQWNQFLKDFCSDEFSDYYSNKLKVATILWKEQKSNFLKSHQSLIDLYNSKKAVRKMPVKINGDDFTFSPGKHNQLQKFIIEEFAPRFAENSECLYVGDTIQKDLVKNEEKLKELGFEITLHDKMPNVVLYSEDKNWIYFVESATSVGAMEPKRIKEIEEMTENVSAGKIYVTAFLDFKTFKKFSESLAWETEVWIADMPDHMIHLNGDKFLGPRR